MGELINPKTGRPFPGRKLSDQDLIQILTSLRTKIDYLNQQSLQLGLYCEFIVNELGEADITIDLTKFPAFAEERFKEIQAEVTTMVADREKEIANDTMDAVEDVTKDLEIDLNE